MTEMAIFATLFIVLAVVLTLAVEKGIKASQAEKSAEGAEPDAAKLQDEYNKMVDKVYSYCVSREIREWEPNKERLLSVIRDINQNQALSESDAKKYFEDGKRRYVESNAKREEEQFLKQKAQADIVGKEKYYPALLEKLKEKEDALEDHERAAASSAMLAPVAGIQPKQKSTVASAAVNSALFGTAAGVAAASRTQELNRSAQASYDSVSEAFNNLATTHRRIANDLRDEVSHLRYSKDKLDARFCSDDDTEEYFKLFDPEAFQKGNTLVRLTRSGKNLEVRVSYRLVGSPRLFDKAANLDGSLQVIARYNGKEIGRGYCSENKFVEFGEFDNLDIGFRNDYERKYNSFPWAIIRIDSDVDVSAFLDDIEIEVLPYHLWAIEKTPLFLH
ncbi:hypothetical protein [Enorma phocaeensis]|uniref:Uncharacterized protein n=1 Tax=Enorma phocaeensis TaxID=1871019 RepID=A0ABT7VB67_9ACTN|nr:hypothetical protein [Enorma phocaeensis]MDM8275752.1 hypothetical protein [Enorma phocaeensis]